MIRRVWVGAAVLLLAGAHSPANDLPDSFTLGRYVPDDAWIYIHIIHNPQRDFITQHWSRVLAAVAASGIDVGIRDFITYGMGQQEKEDFDRKWKTVRDALGAVPWIELGKTEFVYAQRFLPLIPQHVLLLRNDPARADAIAASLENLLRAVASLSPKLRLTTTTSDNATVWTISLENPDVGAQLFRRGDVIGFCSSEHGAADLLDLMAAATDRRAIVDTVGFKKALASVTPPQDGVGYMNISLLQEQVRAFLDTALARNHDDADVATFKRIAFKALDQLDFIDHVVMSRRTRGFQEVWSHRTQLRPDYLEKPLARALTRRKAFDAFDHFIPREATSFCVSTFVDLGLAYNTVMDFIKNEARDEGAQLCQCWNRFQNEKLGFNFNRDVFDWLSGEFVVVGLPTETEAQVNGVIFVRVKNVALAKRKLAAALDWLTARAERFQVMISPAPEVEADGFRAAFHPMLTMMRAKPVVGIYKNWLVFGSSPRAVNKCLATAKGLRSSIRKNARFLNEGIAINSPVNWAGFSDQSRLGEALGENCFAASMLASTVSNQQDAAPLGLILGIYSRLGPVFARLDFFNSTAYTFTWDGDVGRGTKVVNYKPAAEPMAAERTDSVNTPE